MTVPLPPGSSLGPYTIETTVGTGGMGVVYAARDTRLARRVAIKVVSEQFIERFVRESHVIAALNHPRVCTLYDVGPNYLVMEFIEGQSLAEVIARGPLAIGEAVRYAKQIADALAAAHARGIVHRDLKPANVMLADSGVKVLDFGIAKYLEATDPTAVTASMAGSPITEPGEIIGTLPYMAPEQVEGKRVDARSDVFAFGVVFYEMVCGRRPFHGDTAVATMASTLRGTPDPPSRVRRDAPRHVEQLILRCLEKNPASRFQDGRELAGAFAAIEESGAGRRWPAQRTALIAALMLIIGVAGTVSWRSYQTISRVRWVEETAAPEIARLLQADRMFAARALYKQAEHLAPASRVLFKLAEGVAAHRVRFESEPAGAQVYVSDYAAGAGDDLAQWQSLGETPVTFDEVPNWGFFRVRLIKAGYAPRDETLDGSQIKRITLDLESGVPQGMVRVPATSQTSTLPVAALPSFWMDRYEVTNREFKKFVDAGGYQDSQYWKHAFVKDGKALTRQQAMAEFRDTTGRRGPATWQLGTYPDGAENLPVRGISWYEAAAYAEFAGKSLPSVHEWFHAAGIGANSNIVQMSNFNGKAVAAPGTFRGMAPFGTFDMAGNVKEWTMNVAGDGRTYILGGAWDETSNAFVGPDARLPFVRDETFGLRCVLRTAALPVAALRPTVVTATAPAEPSVDDETYRIFLKYHQYDKQPLDPLVGDIDDSSRYWRRETVSFTAGYGVNERVIAHVFLPKGGRPPYQVVAMMGGSTIMNVTRRVEDFDYPYEFIVRSGRALIIPAYFGTLERGPTPVRLPENQERERALKGSMDLGRSIDYLESRKDIIVEKLAFYGISSGGTHGIRLVAVEPRVKAAVFTSAGLMANQPAETSAWNFAPRVRIPVLMVNGRHDFQNPVETDQKPLFEALGTAPHDKRHVLYDGGHRNLVTRPDLIGEVLDWLDKYLGPVK